MESSPVGVVKCLSCSKKLANKWGRKTEYCKKCVARHTPSCKACGQRLSKSGEHSCASVDLKGERRCIGCQKILANSGYERWKKQCGRCEKVRWRQKERKERAHLREQFGGSCSICGYSRCQSALHFHHVDSSEKYDWNTKGNSGASLREIKAHPERFNLLCANCHIEVHHEDNDQGL